MFKKLLKKLYYINENNNEYAIRKGVILGDNCRIMTKNFSSEPYLIKIGNNTTISLDVEFITHDGAVHVLRNLYTEYKNIDIIKPIVIGNNVFVGAKSIILPGVTIGDNTIIAAGSVVTKDISSNLVAGGIPARKISTLEEYIIKNKESFLHTKHMNFKEKQKFVMDKYDFK